MMEDGVNFAIRSQQMSATCWRSGGIQIHLQSQTMANGALSLIGLIRKAERQGCTRDERHGPLRAKHTLAPRGSAGNLRASECVYFNLGMRPSW